MTLSQKKRLPQGEFIALIGMVMASVAFGTDAMMPALTQIGLEISPDTPNRAQLVISFFFLGIGVGTLFTGPLADRFGRRSIVLGGFALYICGAVLAWLAPSLETILLARVLQGLGAAGPRVTIIAVIRDMYGGRQMARIMSVAMMVFTLVPAVAPMIGAQVMAITGWRGIFLAFAVWGVIMALWFGLRQAETLTEENRRPFRFRAIAQGAREVLSYRVTILSTLAQILVFGTIIATVSSAQPIFEFRFDKAQVFPYIFGVISLISAGGSLLNSRLVGRFGMRAVARVGLVAQFVTAATVVFSVVAGLDDRLSFGLFLLFLQTVFFSAGMTIANLTSLAMGPLQHLAGIGASLISAASTIGGLMFAVPVGQAFNGTPLPLALGACCAAATAFVAVQFVVEDQPDQPAPPPVPPETPTP